jgi:superoxide dismutase
VRLPIACRLQVRAAVRNHGGGHYNHALFWNCMAPGDAAQLQPHRSARLTACFAVGSVNHEPTGTLKDAIGGFYHQPTHRCRTV